MSSTLSAEPSVVEKRHKTSELRKLFLKKGVALPDGWSLDSAGSQDVLLAAVKTAALTKKREDEKEAQRLARMDPTASTDEADGFGDIKGGAQFTEGGPAHGLHVSPARAREIVGGSPQWRRSPRR